MIINYIKKNRKTTLFVCLLMVVLYSISFSLVLSGDDFSYSVNRATGLPMMNLFDVLESVAYEYTHWMGRLACFFFAQLCYATKNQLLFRLTYPLIIILILIEIHYLITKEKINDDNLMLLVVETLLFFLVEISVANQTYFWIIGYFTYILPLAFLLPCITYCSDIIIGREETWRPYILLTTFIGCLFIEHYAAIVIGFIVVALFVCGIKNKKINVNLFFLLMVSIAGLLIMVLAPGVRNRPLSSSFDSKRELIYFGYTRFIFTFYTLNQKILLIMALALICLFAKSKNRLDFILIVLLIPIVAMSLILIFNLPLITEDTRYFLTFQWSYYHWDRTGLLNTSWVVIYTAVVFLICFIRLSVRYKNLFIITCASASFISQLIFIVTELACERTSYISYLLIMIIILYILNKEHYVNSKLEIVCIVFLIMVLINYQVSYIEEYKIYRKNDELYRECAKTNCQYIEVYENNYKYVYKTEIDFDDDNNWVLRDIKKYYGINPNCIIKPKRVDL